MFMIDWLIELLILTEFQRVKDNFMQKVSDSCSSYNHDYIFCVDVS